eukprot:848822-Rhodomonas_salina.2
MRASMIFRPTTRVLTQLERGRCGIPGAAERGDRVGQDAADGREHARERDPAAAPQAGARQDRRRPPPLRPPSQRPRRVRAAATCCACLLRAVLATGTRCNEKLLAAVDLMSQG